MRSAEKSGGDANGFAVETDQPQGFGSTGSVFGPTTLITCLLALAAAGAFVFTDIDRTLDERHGILQMEARALSLQLAREGGPPGPLLRELGSELPADIALSITDQGGQTIASAGAAHLAGSPAQLVARTSLADGSGSVWARVDMIGTLTPAFVRAAFAVLLAALFCVLAMGSGARRGETRRPDFTAVIDALPMGLALWSGDGRLVAANASFTERLGLDTLRDGLDRTGLFKMLAGGGYMCVTGQDNDKRSLEVHRSDGRCLLFDERAMPGGSYTLVTDITDRKTADRMLEAIRREQRDLARRYHEEKIRAEAASRSKTAFLAHLSHDIRTPLNHMIGFADLLRHQVFGPLGDTRYSGYAADIKQSGEKLLASFAEILELARLESGETITQNERFSVHEVLSAVERRFGETARKCNVTLSIGQDSDAMLYADRFCLMRMLGNIVDNALRFTPAGGRVTLSAWTAADGVVLEITDTGIGIPEERMEQLSQPFVLGDAAFTREHGGAGLGVAISRAIAEMSGGHLAIDSRVGMGTTVAISLPRDTEAATRAA